MVAEPRGSTMMTLSRIIDVLAGIDSRKDDVCLMRCRVATSIMLLGVMCTTFVFKFFMRPAPTVVYVMFLIMCITLFLTRKYGFNLFLGIVNMTILEASSSLYFFRDLEPIGINNIQMVWSMVFIVVSSLVSGPYLSMYTFGLVLGSKNSMSLPYCSSLPHQGSENCIQLLLEWNYATATIFTAILIFERILSKQVLSTIKAKEALENQKQNSIQKAKLSALGEMAGGIAHEINNPLAIIHGNSEIIQRYAQHDNDILIRSQKIITAAKRIKSITEAMRQLSQGSMSINTQCYCNVASVLQDIYTIYNQKLRGRGISLIIDKDDDLLIAGNHRQFGQIIINLLNNAIEAIGATNGSIHIEARNSENIEIRITNSGPLIPENLTTKMMQPFFTTKSTGKGAGLGLSISERIIKDLQGDIELDQSKGQVSFILTLPKLSKSI